MPESERVKSIPRLAHKKSRTGCQRCRARRVKCNEVHPVCGSCQRHNVSCVYDHGAPTVRVQKTDSLDAKVDYESSEAGSSLAAVSVTSPDPSESRERRILELRLLHQYTKKTGLSLLVTPASTSEHIWTVACPQLAFDHDAVLYAIFALAALHIAKVDTVWAYSDAMDIHRKYLDLALHTHSDDVAHLTKDNADAACIASSMLRICAFAMLSERPIELYTPPLQWLQMTHGSVRVFHATWDWIQDDENSIARRLVNRQPALSPFNESLFLDSNRQGFEYLLERSDPTEAWSGDIEHAYKIAVSYIGSILIAINSGEETGSDICRRTMAFPMLVHPGFVTLVEAQQPRALVVLAHYFAILARFATVWWMGDSGRREVLGIQTILSEEWQEMMHWPLRSIEENYNMLSVPHAGVDI